MSKGIAVTLPLVLVLYDFAFLPGENRLKRALLHIPFFAVATVYVLLRVTVLNFNPTGIGLKGVDLPGLFLPFNIHMERQVLAPVSFFDPWVLASAALFEKALEINPAEAIIHFNLGKAYEAKKDYAGARAEWEKALALDPGYAPARESLNRIKTR